MMDTFEKIIIAFFGIPAILGSFLIGYILVMEGQWALFAVLILGLVLLIVDSVYPYED